MDLKALAQAELARIITAHAGAVVAVVSGSNTASGVRDNRQGDSDLDDIGEAGTTTGKIFVNADTIGVLKNGQAITVGGAAAWVMKYDVDPMGAITMIDYMLGKPK